MRVFDVTGTGFSRWVGIIGKGAAAPEKGSYLIANVCSGQGLDIEYSLLELEQGELFVSGVNMRPDLIPIAYHFVPENQWIKTNLVIHKGEAPCIPASTSGIAVISLLDARLFHRSSVSFFINKVSKFEDITTVFKCWDLADPTCFSDEYDGFMIQGFHMASLYNMDVCREHVRL